jgi:hypothetical protein
MRLNLFPTVAGLWALNAPTAFDQTLYEDLLQVHSAMKTDGEEIWNRQAHNIFDGSIESCNVLLAHVAQKIQELMGPHGRIKHVQGREVVRHHGTEIMPHNDEDECDLQAVYFPFGPELDTNADLMEQVNQYGPNGFAICNPAWRSSGFGGLLMPWEAHAKFWIKPHRGLLVAFDSRAIHFQKPYVGEQPFMNILFNIKVDRING